jgi:hypothetical protein
MTMELPSSEVWKDLREEGRSISAFFIRSLNAIRGLANSGRSELVRITTIF